MSISLACRCSSPLLCQLSLSSWMIYWLQHFQQVLFVHRLSSSCSVDGHTLQFSSGPLALLLLFSVLFLLWLTSQLLNPTVFLNEIHAFAHRVSCCRCSVPWPAALPSPSLMTPHTFPRLRPPVAPPYTVIFTVWPCLRSRIASDWLPASHGPLTSEHQEVKTHFLLSCVWPLATPWTAACQASLSITNSRSLLRLMSIKLVMPSNCLILCRSLLLMPSIFPTIRVFSNESVLCISWLKYWGFSFSHQSFQWIFRADFL